MVHLADPWRTSASTTQSDACPNTRGRGICTRTGQAQIGDCLPPTRPPREGPETLRLVSNAKHSRTANESGGVRAGASARSRPMCRTRRTCWCAGRRGTRRCHCHVVGALERPGLALGEGRSRSARDRAARRNREDDPHTSATRSAPIAPFSSVSPARDGAPNIEKPTPGRFKKGTS
jgi:hypothetical protein